MSVYHPVGVCIHGCLEGLLHLIFPFVVQVLEHASRFWRLFPIPRWVSWLSSVGFFACVLHVREIKIHHAHSSDPAVPKILSTDVGEPAVAKVGPGFVRTGLHLASRDVQHSGPVDTLYNHQSAGLSLQYVAASLALIPRICITVSWSASILDLLPEDISSFSSAAKSKNDFPELPFLLI